MITLFLAVLVVVGFFTLMPFLLGLFFTLLRWAITFGIIVILAGLVWVLARTFF